MRSSDSVVDWMYHSGFTDVSTTSDDAMIGSRFGLSSGTLVNAIRPADAGPLFGTFFNRLLIRMFSQSLFIDVVVQDDGSIYLVDMKSQPRSNK